MTRTATRPRTATHSSKRAPDAIEIEDGAFEPIVLAVREGTTVTWVNRDEHSHFIMSTSGRFASSSVLDTDEQYAVTFEHKGVYAYFCALAPKMVGSIVVT
jgi:plastocyanin